MSDRPTLPPWQLPGVARERHQVHIRISFFGETNRPRLDRPLGRQRLLMVIGQAVEAPGPSSMEHNSPVPR